MKLSPINLHDIKLKILNKQINAIVLYGDILIVEYIKCFIIKLFNSSKTVELEEFIPHLQEQDFFGKNCIITETTTLKKFNLLEIKDSNNFGIIISNENFNSYINSENSHIGFISCYLTEANIVTFIENLLPKEIGINKDAIRFLIDKCNLNNLGSIELEMQKLIYYCNLNNSKFITKEIVQMIVSNYLNNNIDDLFFALIQRNDLEYFTILKNISSDILLIIRIFLKHLNNFLYIKELKLDKANIKLEAIKLKIFFKYIDQFVDAVNSLTIAKIKIILELVYNLEHNYKSYPDISFHAFFTKLYVDVKLVDK